MGTSGLKAPAPVRDLPPEPQTTRSAVPEPPELTQPRYRYNPPPTYPRAARRQHHEGTVRLRVSVDAAGGVDDVEVIASSGSKLLDDAAQEAVRHWRFEPGRRGETSVACRVHMPIHFRLD